LIDAAIAAENKLKQQQRFQEKQLKAKKLQEEKDAEAVAIKEQQRLAQLAEEKKKKDEVAKAIKKQQRLAQLAEDKKNKDAAAALKDQQRIAKLAEDKRKKDEAALKEQQRLAKISADKKVKDEELRLAMIEENKNRISIVMALCSLSELDLTNDYSNDTTATAKAEMAQTRLSLGFGYLQMGNISQAQFNFKKAQAFDSNSLFYILKASYGAYVNNKIKSSNSIYQQAFDVSNEMGNNVMTLSLKKALVRLKNQTLELLCE
jgi:hypothetical protein